MRTLLAIALAAGCYAQTFEVASVKIHEGEFRGRPDIQAVPGSVTMRGVAMQHLLIWSYKVSPSQIGNSPGGDNQRYDITAKAAGPAKVDEMRVMMQARLADRFKLTLHRETREIPAYVLIEAKGGHKLTPSTAADGPGVLPVADQSKMALAGKSATLDQLCMFLGDPLRAPVVDMTGLKGRYDFSFDLTDSLRGARQPGEPEPDPVAILQMTLPKQLGLKLEARKMPIEMLIVDHIEKAPVEN
jgi:uncharacterized protein (TIGR03435 family)